MHMSVDGIVEPFVGEDNPALIADSHFNYYMKPKYIAVAIIIIVQF